MESLKMLILAVLAKEKDRHKLSYYDALRQTANQLLAFASQSNTDCLTQPLIRNFITDDHGSRTRRGRHRHMCKLIDAHLGTRFKDHRNHLLNPPPIPSPEHMHQYFSKLVPPYNDDIDLSYLIVKAEYEMKPLKLTSSTIGQYKHAWIDIRTYFNDHGVMCFE